MDRRSMLGGACLALASVTARRALAKAAGRVTVPGVQRFDIQMPAPRTGKFVPTYQGLTAGRNNVVRVTTSAGVAGYSFLGAAPGEAEAARGQIGRAHV